MLPSLLLQIDLPFGTPAERSDSEDLLLRALSIVALRNARYLRQNPGTELLYNSGVRYAPPDQATAPKMSHAQRVDLARRILALGGDADTVRDVLRRILAQEIFRDIPTIYRRRASDCNDLVCVRIAELWRVGVMAGPLLDLQDASAGGLVYHALIGWPDGSTEDPSLLLGMPGRHGDREAEIAKNEQRYAEALAQWSPYVDGAALDAIVGAYGLLPPGGFR